MYRPLLARPTLARSASCALACSTLLLSSSRARASADTFDLGDGHWGAVSITQPNEIVNTYTSLTAGANAGDTSLLVVSSTGFAQGDLVLVWQSTGVSPAPASGDQTPIDLSPSPVGHWELARVSGVPNKARLDLGAALVTSFGATDTQVVRVPEYTSVTISSGASIVAQAWNGVSGGIVAFLATGDVTSAGAISADGAGYRGGSYVNGIAQLGCSLLDQAPPQGGQKGEGVAPSAYQASSAGRGNVGNGAGGGICAQSGGAGGGNGGQGGAGGRTSAADGSRAVGGLGGAKLVYSLYGHATPGGGGGAGEGFNAGGTSGGAGGGVVLVRAKSLKGSSGVVSARGASVASGGNDGQGGGGAGGSAYLRFVGTATCAGVDVSGGAGGSTLSLDVGPGGGGAGGRVLLQAAAGGTCAVTIACGLAGTQGDANAVDGPHYGAKPASANDPSCVGVNEQAPPTGYCGSNADCPPGEICDLSTGTCVGVDGGASDAGGSDAAAGDGGASDGAANDGASSDAGANDGGHGDGSSNDGASGDGAANGDGALGDGASGSGGDASPDDTIVEGGGCACALRRDTASGVAGALAALFALVALSIRRRSR